MPNEQELAKSLYERWRAGESKSQLEIETWDDATSHGAKFTSYVKRVLGVDTKRPAAMAIAKRNLEKQLLNHGLIPESDRTVTDREMLLLKARQAVLQALRIYNDPTAQFRIDSFLVSMHIAWSCLLQAVLEKSGGDPYYRDSNGNLRLHDGRPRAKSVSDLASDVFDLASSDGQSIKLNLDLLTGLRDQVVHRYIPALDAYMIHEIQANVLNFEKVLVEHFGADAALAGQLQVPLLLSTLRPSSSVESLKELQSQIPPDVISYLERFAGQVPDDIKENSHFRLKVFLTPVAANREKNADSVISFFRENEIPEELHESLNQLGLITKVKHVPADDADRFAARKSQEAIETNLPNRFSLNDHVRAWKYYGVRPPENAEKKADTDIRYCVFNAAFGRYSYTQAWVDKLSEELVDPTRFEEVTGHLPRPKS